MIRIAMRICAEAIRVGWTSVLARATISVTIIYEIRPQAPAFKYASRM